MKKKKPLSDLEIDGFKLVPGTIGKIVDSVWHNEERQELMIRFATGQNLIFKPVESEVNFLNNICSH